MTRTLSAAEAKSRFAESLRLAEAGGVVEITRYGRPVAALVGAEQMDQLRRLEAAGPAEGLASLVGAFPEGTELAEEIDQVVEQRSSARPLNPLGV